MKSYNLNAVRQKSITRNGSSVRMRAVPQRWWLNSLNKVIYTKLNLFRVTVRTNKFMRVVHSKII